MTTDTARHDAAADPGFDPWDYVYGVALLGGAANVIMQLSQRPVGRGVLESPVESGRADLHPIKRGRTTLTYLAVAMMGTDEERRLYQRAVNGSHAQVRSTAASPVAYNAFDPELQLWVAACLYRGFLDVTAAMGIDVPVADDERFYRYAARLGTTLQVKADMWPADSTAFWDYWNERARHIEIDEETRRYLRTLTRFGHLPWPFGATVGRFQDFVTRGLLPPEFRAAMGYEWTAADQRRFTRVMHALGAVTVRLPGPVRRFPFNVYLWDMRRRIKQGRPLV
jgi:uncharacterized protein (DUF2236 family)